MADRTITARLVIDGEDKGASAAVEKVVAAVRKMDEAAKVSAKMEGLAKGLLQVEQASKAVDTAMKARTGLAAAEAGLKATQTAAEATAKALADAKVARAAYEGVKAVAGTEQAKQIEATTKALRDAGAAHRKAEGDVRRATAAVAAETATLHSADAAASRFGADLGDLGRHQATLARQTDLATRALRAQIAAEEAGARAATARGARSAARKEAAGTVVAGAGIIAAHQAKKIGLEAIQSAASFDIAVRKQQEFTDISDTAQATLLKQAKKIGQETQFSNIDVVKAQTAAMQGLPASFSPDLKAAVAEGIVGNVRNFATLMETDLKEGTETIRSYLQTTGKDISTKEKALAEANKATNQLVKMAKLGGMSGEDVAQFSKFAAASSTSAGISTDSMMTLGALARRGGLRGDEAGVAMRSMASKIASPTADGIAALNAAGINYDDYVHMPDRISTDALESQFKRKLGKDFTPAIREKIEAINTDKSIIGNRADYTKAIVSAVSDILGKKKDGTVRASDSARAAKAVAQFHKFSAQSVDAEGLLDAAMTSKMTLAQLNAWLTDKHGGKGAITQRQWDEFKASREAIGHAADDPDWAKNKADKVMAGVGGSVENMKGSWENFILQIGEANKELIKFTADGLGAFIDKFSSLDKTTQQTLSLGAGAAGLGTGAYGAYKVTKGLLGFGDGSVALNGSAAALTKSAALLDAAALKLASGLPGGPAEKAPEVVKAAPLAALGLFGVTLGTAAGAAFATYATAKVLPGVIEKEGLGASDPATGEKLETEVPKTTPWLRNWLLGTTTEETGKAIGAEIGKGIVSVPVPTPPPEAFDGLKRSAGEAGTEAGQKAGEGVRQGVEEKAPEVIQQGSSLFQRLKDVFASGINVPINLQVDGAGGAGGSGVQTASTGGGGGGGKFDGLIHKASVGGTGGFTAGSGGADGGARGNSAQGAPGTGNAGGAGLRVKGGPGGQAFGGGATSPALIGLAEQIQKGGGVSRFTAFNDRYHAGTGSKHAHGLAMDVTGNPGRIIPNVHALMQAQGLVAGRDYRIINEYAHPSRRATGGHVHVQFQNRRAADAYGRGMPQRRSAGPEIPASPSSLQIPDAPEGGIGGGRRGDVNAAADRFHTAMDRFENAAFHGQVDVNLSGGGGRARVTGVRASGRGAITADMGVSMPHIELGENGGEDWT